MVFPVDSPLLRRSASSAKVREGEQPEVRTIYREEFANCRMPMEHARLAWRRFVSDGTMLTLSLSSRSKTRYPSPGVQQQVWQRLTLWFLQNGRAQVLRCPMSKGTGRWGTWLSLTQGSK